MNIESDDIDSKNNVNAEQIPDELKSLQQWVCWQLEETDRGITKVPKVAWSRRANASTTNSKTWAPLNTALDHFNQGHHNGVGFVFTEHDPYCGIDLDKCREPESGKIEPWAVDILKTLNSYSEVSQSGKGIHIIIKAKLPGKGTKKHLPGTTHEVEIYDRGRFFITTGDQLEEYPADVRERQDEVVELYHSLQSNATDKPTEKKTIQQVSPVLSDDNIIKIASEARNGQKFNDLMAGNWEPHYPGGSESEADGGLAALIGFYTQDFDQILRIIERSQLWDDKWKRKDYQESTINGALAKLTDFWGYRPTTVGVNDSSPPAVEERTPPPNKFDLKALSPPAGFLREYMKFQEPLSEAPEHLHLFSGLLLLSSAIGKRVYFTVATERKYSNLWIVLIGGSGTKKTTVVNAAGTTFNEAGFKDNRLPTQFTSEILIEMLSKNPVGTFFWSEWGSTMEQWSKTYASDIMSILTDLYDSGYFSRWLRSDKFEIEGACINMLCGCTPNWLKTVLTPQRASMGFWPRFLFVPTGEPEKYLPIPPTPDPEKIQNLAAMLKAISDSVPESYPQEANFDEVEGLYGGWYITAKEAARKSGDELRSAFLTRLLDYAKKIAILVELSQVKKRKGITAVKISIESMEYAIQLVEWLEGTAQNTVAQATKSAMSELESRVLDYIKTKDAAGVLRRDISQRFHREDNRAVTWALENLVNAELVRMTHTKPPKGRPGKRYFHSS